MRRDQLDVSDIELSKQCFRLSQGAFESGSPWQEEQFLSTIKNPSNTNCFLFNQDKLVGYILLSTVLDEADLLLIGVAKEEQRKNIGQKLLQEACLELDQKEVKKIFIEVRQSNSKAISFYQKNGFVEIAKRRNYYQTPKEDALIWMLEL
ncbi:ribosomal protein S18-alanine N-acetyltransferase [Vagococcus hydrophili]|uniref:[Ribosomal protein bS18]-alanine N-acetyltransferase n=1 Tax=Vagococcus hydrophili TaxID=2714947 RepID=A0A6G8AWU6_9ENTE|nr:ribosomal protein S18-alanine N-acetyltransferase [Vagococcus hydrophili]QIL49466.1 ribosomal protein S18-alanine N-acetyltransferase [Vagococcus hydrophili]